jgi:hypothetical protein
MDPIRLRSLSRVILLIVLLAIVLLHPSLTAQTGKPSNVSIAKYPALRVNVWPADVNGDGRIDLVAGAARARSTDLVVRLGRGGGSFGPERVVAASRVPVTVGDLNRDGRIDIIAASRAADASIDLFALRGNGDGTFGAARRVAWSAGFGGDVTGQLADMDGDGHRDLVVAASAADAVLVFPGNGDLTFGAPVTLATNRVSRQFVVADLNNDERPDIAVATQAGQDVDVFLNTGALTFTYAAIPLPRGALAIAAADIDADGSRDLIVTTASESTAGMTWEDGFVHLLRGHGGGGFDAPLSFPTGTGPLTVVTGDFNGDGVVDVATGNRSDVYEAQCVSFAGRQDTISILRGLGGGRLGEPLTFALDSVRPSGDAPYHLTHHALRTADVNSDGRPDLIASPGAVLLNADRLVAPAAIPMVDISCDDAAATSTRPASADGLPPDWASQDVGAVGAPGAADYDGSRYTVRGAGTDIWNGADEFHFAYQAASGDFAFTAYVPFVQNVNRWTKAGLMIRDALTAGARHAALFQTPTTEKGIAFQRRAATGGASVHTSGPLTAPPAWLRLERRGDNVSAFSRPTAAAPWTLIGRQAFSGLPAGLYVGFAVGSHVDGTLAEAWFEHVTLEPLASGVAWDSRDIGAVAAPGSASIGGTTATVTGSGADVWGTADELRYLSREATGDFEFSARVATVENLHYWTKAGLMIRDGFAANAKHAFIIATPRTTRGVAFQRRPATGGASVHTAGPAAAPPGWLRLVRSGNVIAAYHRTAAADPWTIVDTQTFSSLPATLRVGYAMSSHIDGTLATATFDSASFVQGTPTTFTVSPQTWTPPAGGGTQVVTITSSSAGALWTASSDANWLTLSTTSGTGSGTVTLTAAANNGPERTATATIAGHPVRVTQAAAADVCVDPDRDRLCSAYETATGRYVSPTNTGTNPNNPDTDGDGVNDGDEVLITAGGLDLRAMGASPVRKNIFLEYDWVDDNEDSNSCSFHSHRPTQEIMDRVAFAFASASVANPDGTTGITLIQDWGQGGPLTGGNLVAHGGNVNGGVGDTDYVSIKSANFASNRSGYFHYVEMVHWYTAVYGSSGQAELFGNDMIVSLGCYGTASNVANTIVHELGHNLGLGHGGDTSCNWKPNYNSVMNYRFQFPGVDTSCNALGNYGEFNVLDYSRGTRLPLNETSLNEVEGTCGSAPIDWNSDGRIQPGLLYDLNRRSSYPSPSTPVDNSACGGELTTLTDYNDWANLYYAGIRHFNGLGPSSEDVHPIVDCDNPYLPRIVPGEFRR